MNKLVVLFFILFSQNVFSHKGSYKTYAELYKKKNVFSKLIAKKRSNLSQLFEAATNYKSGKVSEGEYEILEKFCVVKGKIISSKKLKGLYVDFGVPSSDPFHAFISKKWLQIQVVDGKDISFKK